jgi:hypothetical protein
MGGNGPMGVSGGMGGSGSIGGSGFIGGNWVPTVGAEVEGEAEGLMALPGVRLARGAGSSAEGREMPVMSASVTRSGGGGGAPWRRRADAELSGAPDDRRRRGGIDSSDELLDASLGRGSFAGLCSGTQKGRWNPRPALLTSFMLESLPLLLGRWWKSGGAAAAGARSAAGWREAVA